MSMQLEAGIGSDFEKGPIPLQVVIGIVVCIDVSMVLLSGLLSCFLFNSHVYFQELRQFVQAGAPEETANASYPRIISGRLSLAIGIGQLVTHRAELEHVEQLVVEAEAPLPEQHRPW